MKPALLLVDLQEDYLKSPGLQPRAEVLVAPGVEQAVPAGRVATRRWAATGCSARGSSRQAYFS